MTDAQSLLAQAEEFADRLTRIFRTVAPESGPFVPTILVDRGDRLAVRQEPGDGVPLSVDGVPLIYLTARFRCTWDGAGHFLAVEQSTVAAYVGKPSGQALFRYEYLRSP